MRLLLVILLQTATAGVPECLHRPLDLQLGCSLPCPGVWLGVRLRAGSGPERRLW
jgi:hypothetical protein